METDILKEVLLMLDMLENIDFKSRVDRQQVKKIINLFKGKLENEKEN
jgi:hypothetical protein